MAAPGGLVEYHPFCAANPVHAWPGAESHDVIEYHNGRVIERRFTAWQEGAGYELEATDAGRWRASVSWSLAPSTAGTSLAISLTLRPASGGVWTRVLDPMIRFGMARYLDSVLDGIEWRAVTGTAVRRNQFGAHPWFSRRL